jgi:4-amino-4-deoxy-L-arabinose transferase-like glycosyltransferase
MARIPNWISHQSIAHFPTNIFRQLYQPPFSEFFIMHINILSGSDYFSNSVQLAFLVFSGILIVSIVELFNLSFVYKLIAVVLTISIPEIILQASSTQNDIVVSFFILSTIYFAVKTIKEINIKNTFFLGLSIGLALLTKGTAYIFLAPILMFFAIGILSKIYVTKDKKYLVYPILAILITISLNSGHYTRNYKLSNNILGIDQSESMMYSNQNMSPMLLVSNLIKNVGLHSGPYPINYLSDKVIFKLHSLMGVNINNPDTNIAGMHYTGSPDIPNHEDSASNPIHLILILLSLILIVSNFFKTKNFGKIGIYILIFLSQAILFSLYLKWQPWNSRLHVSLFLVSIPIILYAANQSYNFFKILRITIPILILYALGIILINKSRPIISNAYTSPIKITDDRYKKYFTNRPELYDEYKFVIENLENIEHKNVGLMFSTDDWEYPLFTTSYSKNINPIHINVSNITKDIPYKDNFIDCIISTTTNNSVIKYNGKIYSNMNEKNNFIWLYK